MHPQQPSSDRLVLWEKAFLLALMLSFVGLGAATLARSAYMQHRRTDAGVYFRAAWALRSGESPYHVADDNGWHYHYSPMLAIVLMPLADPPSERANRGGPWMPYPLSIVIWYVVNLAALAAALHIMAEAIEETAPRDSIHQTARGGRRWWRLRLLPLLVCAIPIGAAQSHGQVTCLMALSLAGACAASIRGWPGRAGAWLACGFCLKPFIAVVLLVPLIRGQKKFFAGFLAGLAVCMILLPLVALGPARAMNVYEDWYELRISAMSVGRVNEDIKDELRVFNGSYQSWGTVWYKAIHRDPGQWPLELPPIYRALQILMGVVLIGLIVAVFLRRAPSVHRDRLKTVLAWGALALAVLPSVSTSHSHYFALAFLLVQGLIASQWELSGQVALPRAWVALFVAYGLSLLLAEVLLVSPMPVEGIVPHSSLLLLALGVIELRRLSLWSIPREENASIPHDPDNPES